MSDTYVGRLSHIGDSISNSYAYLLTPYTWPTPSIVTMESTHSIPKYIGTQGTIYSTYVDNGK